MTRRIDVHITENRVADSTRSFVENITRLISGPFILTSAAQGGYATATLNLACSQVDAWRMLGYIGKRIVFKNALAPTDMIVWEGLIYNVSVDDGKSAVSRSLANTYNQVRVTYSTVDTSTTPPTVGAQATTADADDTASQASYGIRELSYAIGGSSATEAANLRDVLLSQYKRTLPSIAAAQRGGGVSAEATVTIQCVGAWETLDKRIYTQTALTGNVSMDTIIKAILTAKAQFASTDQSNIAVNARTNSRYFSNQLTAQAVINGLCAKGGTVNLRWYFGLYENGLPYYNEEPTSVAYHTRRFSPDEAIYDATTGLPVPPFLVKPGRIIRVDDLLPDAVAYNTTLDDPRAFLISETQYTSPNLLTLIPQAKDPSQLQLARMGLTEVGA